MPNWKITAVEISVRGQKSPAVGEEIDERLRPNTDFIGVKTGLSGPFWVNPETHGGVGLAGFSLFKLVNHISPTVYLNQLLYKIT